MLFSQGPVQSASCVEAKLCLQASEVFIVCLKEGICKFGPRFHSLVLNMPEQNFHCCSLFQFEVEAQNCLQLHSSKT